jgi:UDP-glucose 4-epimerase
MAKILVTGGAGYIGSHMTDLLLKHGHQPLVFDNLQTGFRDAVLDAKLVVGDLADEKALAALFAKEQFDAVMHFAAFIQVGESVSNPALYYQNNVVNTLNLLVAMLEHDVKNFIFSSSAAVYGEPKYTPIDEEHPKNPLNPYGYTKFMVEQVLQDYTQAYNLRSISLRYFNAAGADPDGRLGERHNPESHLIPLVLQAASGRRNAISVYGEDYPTKDGTCIRDYIHIVDLCQAHLLALNKLLNGGATSAYNLGNGNGFSILEVIETAKAITNKPIKTIKAERRAGDPAVLVADAAKAKKELGWQPKFSELSTIIEHAWRWELTQTTR